MSDREILLMKLEDIGNALDLAGYRNDAQCVHDVLVLLQEQEPVIVRCKDCKYWTAGTCLNDKISGQIGHCGCYPNFTTDSDWFCAEGELK